MRHLRCCCMRLEMIVDPSREDGRFHGRRPRLWKRLHPQVQSQSRGGYRTFCIDTATAVLPAVADRFLVNIQTDVVHPLTLAAGSPLFPFHRSPEKLHPELNMP